MISRRNQYVGGQNHLLIIDFKLQINTKSFQYYFNTWSYNFISTTDNIKTFGNKIKMNYTLCTITRQSGLRNPRWRVCVFECAFVCVCVCVCVPTQINELKMYLRNGAKLLDMHYSLSSIFSRDPNCEGVSKIQNMQINVRQVKKA